MQFYSLQRQRCTFSPPSPRILPNWAQDSLLRNKATGPPTRTRSSIKQACQAAECVQMYLYRHIQFRSRAYLAFQLATLQFGAHKL
jgi:hypothetical protein